MEFAAAALTSLAEAGTAAAGTAAAGAATAGSAIGGASTAFSVLSGGSTVLSMLNATRAGAAKAQSLNAQADDTDTQGQIETMQGIDRRNSLKANFVQAIGDRDVATAASGVDLSFGTPAITRAKMVTDEQRTVNIDEETQASRIARLQERAANLRIQASQANAGGLGTAAATLLQGGASLLKRG